MSYFTNEGIYGALNYLHWDDPSVRPEVLIQFKHNVQQVSLHIITLSKNINICYDTLYIVNLDEINAMGANM